MAGVKISMYLNIHEPLKSGHFPVKLRVYSNYKTKYYPTGISCSKADFEASYLNPKPKGELKKLKDKITEKESKAKTIVQEMKGFNLERFERLMFAPSGSGQDIFFQYGIKIDQLKKEDQLKTARCYENSMSSLKTYLQEKSRPSWIAYNAITADWLRSYEKWMLSRGNSLTTVGIYLRPLRYVFNEAIRLGVIDIDTSPFGRGKYIIPAGANVKKALNKLSLAKLFNVSLHESDPMLKARDFFFFSYVCNGINFKDISRLRYSNIIGDALVFTREKTKRTRRGAAVQPIRAILNDFAKSVIEKYGSKGGSTSLIFPIINDRMTEDEKRKTLDQFIKNTNAGLRKLALLAGVDREISTYYARHSFSTIARNSGASIEFISQSLGHTDIKTTQNYLDSFEDDVKREIAGKLMDF